MKNASGANTIDWEGNVIETVVSGDGDDHITGNAADNTPNGNEGADTILGKAGDDVIDVDDPSFGDTVYCGAGEEAVYYDRDPYGFFSDYLGSDCEHRHS